MTSCPIPNPRRAAALLVASIVVATLAAITWPRPAHAYGLLGHIAAYAAGGVAAHEVERYIDHRESASRDRPSPPSLPSAYPTPGARAARSAVGGAGLYAEPGAGAAPIVSVIDGARQAVDLNVYYLSSKPILEALHRAVGRGVQVRVILDQKPYGIHNDLVIREANNVQATGAALHWAPMRFEQRAFDHAKYVCSESACEIGTANFDPSAFSRNREYLYVSGDAGLVQAARGVFDADWNGRRAPESARKVLVLSPGAEQALLWVIHQPGPVSIETEELGNARGILDALSSRGSAVRLILPDSISAGNRRNAQWLAQHGVQVRLMPRRTAYMHAKIIVASQAAFMGSQNFSETSLQRNREMGLLLGPTDAQALQRQFDADWAQSDAGETR